MNVLPFNNTRKLSALNYLDVLWMSKLVIILGRHFSLSTRVLCYDPLVFLLMIFLHDLLLLFYFSVGNEEEGGKRMSFKKKE